MIIFPSMCKRYWVKQRSSGLTKWAWYAKNKRLGIAYINSNYSTTKSASVIFTKKPVNIPAVYIIYKPLQN